MVLGGNSANELWLSFSFVCKRLWKCGLIFWRKVSQNVRKEKFTILFGHLKKLHRKPELCHGSVSQGQLAEINVLDSNPSCPHRRKPSFDYC